MSSPNKGFMLILIVFFFSLASVATGGALKVVAQGDCSRSVASTIAGLARIQARNCLRIGVIDNYAPMSDLENEEWVGFEIRLGQALAEGLLGDAEAVDFINIEPRINSVSRLANDQVDLVIATLSNLASLPDTPIANSEVYLEDELALLVQADSNVQTIEQLQEQPVAIMGGEPLFSQVRTFFDRKQIRVTPHQVRNDMASSIENLKDKTFTAIVGSRLRLAPFAAADETLTMIAIDEFILDYRIALLGDDELLQSVNCALAAISTQPEWQQWHEALLLAATPRTVVAPTACEAAPTPTTPPTPTLTPSHTPSPSSTRAAPPTPPPTASPTLTAEPPTATPTPTPMVERLSALTLIQQRGVLLAGVKADAPLFGSYSDNEGWTGFEIDLMRAFAERWLGDSAAVDFVRVTSTDRLDRLIQGNVDILAATMTHNKERDRVIDFSQTYYLDGQNILVNTDVEWPTTDAERIKALEGKTIAAVKNSTSLRRISEFARENAIDIEIAEFEQYDQALEPLLAGQVDALTTDRGILAGLALADPDRLMILLDENFSKEPYGLGVRAGDHAFVDLVNYTLQEMKDDGTYDQLYKAWFCEKGRVSRTCDPYLVEVLPGEPPFTFATAPLTATVGITGASVVDKLREQGFFSAGVKYDSAPFGYRNEDDSLVGFEVDLMREFARRWLGNPDAVEFAQVVSSDRIPKLLAGNIDLIAATMTHNKVRDAQIDFSQTYYLDGQNILVRKADNWRVGTNAERIRALDGAVIGAIKGSTSIDNIQKFAETYNITIEIAQFDQYDQAIQPLLNRKIDGLTTDRGILIGQAQQYPNELVVLLDENFSTEPYGLGIRSGDHQFRDLINFTLQEMKEDGTYDLLYRYWFGISFIMQEQDLDNEERYDLIRRYWIDDTENPVTQWQPYGVEHWPGTNYFTGTVTLTNGQFVRNDLAPMIYVPAGSSFLGTTRSLANDANQHPGINKEQLIVNIDAFYVDQHEVTNHQYRQCVDARQCTAPKELYILGTEYFYAEKYKNHPVVQVTWEQANNYCAVYGKQLPTEAQWEKAARFGATTENNYLYPWGDSDEGIQERATYANSSYRQDFANPVGIYRFDIPAAIHGFSDPIISLQGASPLGVLDLAGNVQEWTADCYDHGFYAELADGDLAALQNPHRKDVCRDGAERTVRSSGFFDQKYTLATVFRQGKTSNDTGADHLRGFRCVATADQAPATRLYVAP